MKKTLTAAQLTRVRRQAALYYARKKRRELAVAIPAGAIALNGQLLTLNGQPISVGG